MAERGTEAPGVTPFSRRLLAVTTIVLLVVLIWLLADLLLLTFAGVVFAIALLAAADAMQRFLRVPAKWSVLAAVLAIVVLLSLIGWFVGDALVSQLSVLKERIPTATQAAMGWLRSHTLGLQILDLWNKASQEDFPLARVMNAAWTVMGGLASAGLVLVLAVYLAAGPEQYTRGLVRLLPIPYRERFARALSRSGEGLKKWLLGQSISMLFVGGATALGLWALDIPLALALGLISGLLAFIPFFGALAAGLLSVLMAFVEGPQAALYVTLLAIAIQQVEGNVLMPLVQRWAVALPPVLGIMSSLIFGVLFGIAGVLFASPLMVVAMILVQSLYVEEFLERDTPG